MSLKGQLNAACAGLAMAALAVSAQVAAAQPQIQAPTQGKTRAKTQAAAQNATGKATTDAPAQSQAQGTAWAVKQGAQPRTAAAAPAAITPPAAKVVAHGDIVETLRASGQFTTFLKAADAASLTGVLKSNQNLTVFAPTDAAFQALPAGELDRLMADREQLQKLLTHHVINARVDSAKIRGAKGPVPSIAGDQILLNGAEAGLKVDNADIVQPDVIASNGVIQVVDRVLAPGAAAASANAQPAAATEASAAVTTGAQDAKRPPARQRATPKR